MFAGLASLVKQKEAEKKRGPAAPSVPTAPPAPKRERSPAVPAASDVIAELRAAGLPATLFGESADDRRARLERHRNGEPAGEAPAVSAPAPAPKPHEAEDAEATFNANRAAAAASSRAVVAECEEALRAWAAGPPTLPHPAHEAPAGDESEEGVAADTFTLLWVRRLLAEWRLRLCAMDFAAAMAPEGRELRAAFAAYQRSLEPLRAALTEHTLPPKLRHCVATAFGQMHSGAHDAAEGTYYAFAVGSEAWHIGLFGGGPHQRKVLTKAQRGNVVSAMNNDDVRAVMLAVKMLLSEGARLIPKA